MHRLNIHLISTYYRQQVLRSFDLALITKTVYTIRTCADSYLHWGVFSENLGTPQFEFSPTDEWRG